MLDELQIDLKKEYGKNPRFRRYVDKYCFKYESEITVEEALTHELVRQVYLYYKEEELKGESVNESVCLCF